MNTKELLKIENNLCGIYKITSPSNKIYIGQSVNIKNRYRAHLKNYNLCDTKLKRSFKKYGADSHKFEIVTICKKEELSDFESYYITQYNSLNDGLNMIDRNYTLTNLSKCKNNYKWTEERKSKQSELITQWWANNTDYDRGDEWRKKISNSRKGLVTAKNKNGEFITITKEQYKLNKDLVGVTKGVLQPKLNKAIECITDNKEFVSIKEAAKYYGYKSSGNIVDAIKKGLPLGKVKHGRDLYFKYKELETS